jgi:DNA-binding beta-propeller fold protein YncE
MIKSVFCTQKYIRKSLAFILAFLIFVVIGCATKLNDFYDFRALEILELGSDISDVILDPSRSYLYLADYENNAILRVDVSGEMTVNRKLIVGSHPIALDLTKDQRYLVVAFYGESNLKKIDLETFVPVDDTLHISLVDINDFICAPNDRIYISGENEHNAISIDMATGIEQFEIIKTGELLINDDGSKIFLATENIVQKYDLSTGFITQEGWSAQFGFKAKINHFVMGPNGDQLFLCMADDNDENNVQNVFAYNTEDLTMKGEYEIRSAGMGVAISKDGKRVFCAPSKSDKAGVFITEFDSETKIEKEYYLAAGNIKARGMVLDNDERYLYVIVNTSFDNDSFEPYNNNSFDLQRIEIK